MTTKQVVADAVRSEVANDVVGKISKKFFDLMRRLLWNSEGKALDPERVMWFLQRAGEGVPYNSRHFGRSIYLLECRRHENLLVSEYYPIVLTDDSIGFESYFKSTIKENRYSLTNKINHAFESIPRHPSLDMWMLSKVLGCDRSNLENHGKVMDLHFILQPIMKFVDGKPISLMPKPKIEVYYTRSGPEAHVVDVPSLWAGGETPGEAVDKLFTLLFEKGEPSRRIEYEIVNKY